MGCLGYNPEDYAIERYLREKAELYLRWLYEKEGKRIDSEEIRRMAREIAANLMVEVKASEHRGLFEKRMDGEHEG